MSAEKWFAVTSMQNRKLDQDKLENIISLFDEAELKLKEIERLHGQLSIPSINELRYVGYHLVSSLIKEERADFLSQIEKAESHCKRAIYDAVESGIIYLLGKVSQFKDDYSKASDVLSVLPNYTALLSLAEQAAINIDEVKSDHYESRDKYYEECQPIYLSLKKIVHELDVARPLINGLIEERRVKIEERQLQDKKETRKFIIMVVVTLVAGILSVAYGWLFE